MILNEPIDFRSTKRRELRLTSSELTFWLTLFWVIISICFAVTTRLEVLPMKYQLSYTTYSHGERIHNKTFNCGDYEELADLVNEHMTKWRLDTEYNKVQLVKIEDKRQ